MVILTHPYWIRIHDRQGRTIGDFTPYDLRLSQIPADVLVFKEGDYAVAVDGKTKEVIARSTDHAEVIQASIDHVASQGGGKVYIDAGECDLGGKDVSLVGKSNIVVVGAGVGATIIKRGGFVKNDSGYTENVVFAFMTVDGMNEVPRPFNFAENSKNFWLVGVHARNTKQALYWGGCSLKAVGCIFENLGTGDENMVMGHNPFDDDYALFAYNRFIYTLDSGTGGMLATGATKDVIVVGNMFVDEHGVRYAPLGFENSNGVITRVVVEKNVFINLGGTNKGINIGNKPDGNFSGSAIVKNNLFYLYKLNVKGFRRVEVEGNIFEKPAGYAINLDITDKAYAIIKSNVVYDPSEVNNEWPDNVAIYAYDWQGEVIVEGNIIVDTRDTPKMVNGIALGEARNLGAYEAIVKDNVILNGTGNGIKTGSNVNALIRDNRSNMPADISGKLYVNSGVAVFSGDGSTAQFKVEHGLVKAPSKVIVTPLSADAKDFAYAEADDTYIYFNFSTAPPSGTDNVKLAWYAEV